MSSYTGQCNYLGIINFGVLPAPCFEVTVPSYNPNLTSPGSDLFILAPSEFPQIPPFHLDICKGMQGRAFVENSSGVGDIIQNGEYGEAQPFYEYSTSGGTKRWSGGIRYTLGPSDPFLGPSYFILKLNQFASMPESEQYQYPTSLPAYVKIPNGNVIRASFSCTINTVGQETYRLTLDYNPTYDNLYTELFGPQSQSDFPVAPIDPDSPTNPYLPIIPSGPSEGEGTFDFDSDPVPLPPIPTLSSSNTGFTRIFNPTLSQVQALANYLWTDESFFKTVWNQIKQVFDNPISAIIAFNLVPVAVPDAGNVEFKLMYIPTGVTMNVAASQFVDVDCGTLTVERVYGSALDYSPYTKISCFLPFVGTVTLNTDEVMNRTLQVKYRVDICSGACVAIILVDGTVMYQFTGHCAINIPMNGADFSTYVSALTAAAKIGLGAATGAGLIGAAAGVPEVTQTTSQTSTRKTERNPETGRQITSWTKDVQRNVEETVTKASHDGLTPANVANTVGSVMGSKPYIERSGSFTGNSGYLGVRRPYLIIERPNLCMPANFQSLNGFPAMMTLPLSSCKGFTRVQQVQLTKCTATNPEQAEILEFLKAGVYL